jgi:hypothetical protein
MCVGKAADAQLVLDLLDKHRHRDAVDDVRRHGVHRFPRDQAGMRHEVPLRFGLDPAQLVHERRPLSQLSVRHHLLQLDHGLRPDPLAERYALRLPQASHRLGE